MTNFIICYEWTVFYLGQMLCRKENDLALYSVIGVAGEKKKRMREWWERETTRNIGLYIVLGLAICQSMWNKRANLSKELLWYLVFWRLIWLTFGSFL